MKKIWILIAILFLPTLSLHLKSDVFNIRTKINIEVVAEEKKNTAIENLNLILLVESPPPNTIVCFDVNENGLIAIGLYGSERQKIIIYDEYGNFQYGYEFNGGTTYGIEWDDDNILIYRSRGSLLFSVNTLGKIVDVVKYENSYESSKYLREEVFSKNRVAGNNEYFLTNDIGLLSLFSDSNSQVVVKNEEGSRIIYDVSDILLSRTLLSVFGFFAFFSIALFAIVKTVKQLIHKKQ